MLLWLDICFNVKRELCLTVQQYYVFRFFLNRLYKCIYISYMTWQVHASITLPNIKSSFKMMKIIIINQKPVELKFRNGWFWKSYHLLNFRECKISYFCINSFAQWLVCRISNFVLSVWFPPLASKIFWCNSHWFCLLQIWEFVRHS